MGERKNSMDVQAQANAFATMTICGALLGVTYDFLGLLVKILRGGTRLRTAADFVFGAAAAAGVISAGLYLCINPFRLFVFAALMIGFVLYMTSLGTIVRILNRKVHRSVKKSLVLDEKF